MNRTIMTMAAVSALAIGAPALSQTASANITARIGQLQTEIQTGVRTGIITRDEATTLRQQLRLLRQTERQYAVDGLTRAERQDLQNRIQSLRQQIRYAERTGTGRYGQSGYIDANGDGWDDRDYDRDGRLDDYGQGGPYEAVQCETRTGIGGVIDSVFGRTNDDCVLGVGQRVTSGLYAVPYSYRNQYRDGNGVYYRSDGRAIYQIDARTHTVLRVYGID